MSFDWNLSSDEEETFDEWAAFDTLNTSQQQQPTAVSTSSAQVLVKAGDSSSSEDEGRPRSSSHFSGIEFNPVEEAEEEEVEEDVDWEDADQQQGADDTFEKLASDTKDAYDATIPNLRPVTLNLNQSADQKEEKKTTKKRLSKKRFRYEQLTPDLQYLLSNLEKAHLLSLTATAMVVSRHCSSDESLSIAHSLIPLAWMQTPTSAPTMEDLRSFCSFFFHLVHPTLHLAVDAVARRSPNWRKKQPEKTTMALSQPFPTVDGQFAAIQYRTEEYASFLSTRLQPDGIPTRIVQEEGHYHQYDEVQLFISMARSLGWRTRFVMALEPCQRDLDPDHPIFVAMSTRNVFQRLWKDSKKDDSKRPAKRSRNELVPINQDSSPPESKNLAMRPIPRIYETDISKSELPLCWVEVLCVAASSKRKKANASKLNWIHIDPARELVDSPDSVEVAMYARHEGITFAKSTKKRSIVYALAAEHLSMADKTIKMRLSDVTPRYASSFVDSLKARGVVRGKSGPLPDELRADKWWVTVLRSVNTSSHTRREELRNKGKTQAEPIPLDEDSDAGGGKPAAVDVGMKEIDELEEKQFQESKRNEPIPTSKTAFKSNPVYTLPSLLNSNEVLKPDAKQRICGLFKGEFVFRRSDVETALAANKWLYKGYKVKETELETPIKRVKARMKGVTKSFKALKSYGVGQSNDGSEEARGKIIDKASKALPDGMENLYASWQTEAWRPSVVGPNDPIPTNEYKNIELALLNPGLVHIDERHVAKVAKKLGIPYAPCLLGFEGNGGNRTPMIRGIVVHQHNEEILREANEEMASHFLQEEHENRQRAILLRWKRLMIGVLTKKRLDQAYG